MTNGKMVTLYEPPPLDHSKAPVENAFELTQIPDMGPDVFTNTYPLWVPPGVRGVYGGAAIAQALSAAQHTVPSDFLVHSMHCYFVLGADSEVPIFYHVERARDGRNFATRTVQARQRGHPVITTTLSFSREGSGGKEVLQHAAPMPTDALLSPQHVDENGIGRAEEERSSSSSPALAIGIANEGPNSHPENMKFRRFMRARGRISVGGGHQAHLCALAYFSDSNFLLRKSHAHGASSFSPETVMEVRQAMKRMKPKQDIPILSLRGPHQGGGKEYKEEVNMVTNTPIMQKQQTSSPQRENGNKKNEKERRKKEVPEVGLIASLDISIYFHNPKAFHADAWMFLEMESPWAGEGRGLVMSKIWSQEGVLIATCIQEGVVRIKQDPEKPSLVSKI